MTTFEVHLIDKRTGVVERSPPSRHLGGSATHRPTRRPG